jgi:hypothetical protein
MLLEHRMSKYFTLKHLLVISAGMNKPTQLQVSPYSQTADHFNDTRSLSAVPHDQKFHSHRAMWNDK